MRKTLANLEKTLSLEVTILPWCDKNKVHIPVFVGTGNDDRQVLFSMPWAELGQRMGEEMATSGLLAGDDAPAYLQKVMEGFEKMKKAFLEEIERE